MSDNLPQANSLILIAFIPIPRDLEVSRVQGWYRIPIRTAPKVVSVDYLAFYQPASFGDQKWCIEMVAKVRGHELVTRAGLMRDQLDHPKAREEYFKIQLGTLMSLPDPIRARKWKRITFLYTTGHCLLTAETINDMDVHSDERKTLWQSLRDSAEKGQDYAVPDVDFSLEVLAALLGIRDMDEMYKVKNDTN